MYVFSVLVNAHSLSKFVKCPKLCKIVFCSKNIQKCVKDASVALVEMFNELGIDETEERIETFDGGDEEIEIIDCNSDDEGKGTNKKPFGPYFEKHLSRTVISSSKAEIQQKTHSISLVLLRHCRKIGFQWHLFGVEC